MHKARADQHLAALELARQAAGLGGYLKIICQISGLDPRQVRELFFSDGQSLTPRPPTSIEWVFRWNLTGHVHVSLLATFFAELSARGLTHGEAMLAAYRMYRNRVLPLHDRENTLDFNKAVVFVRLTFGLWGGEKLADLVRCPRCSAQYVDAYGVASTLKCPLCVLRSRVSTDKRVRRHFMQLGGDASMTFAEHPKAAEPSR